MARHRFLLAIATFAVAYLPVMAEDVAPSPSPTPALSPTPASSPDKVEWKARRDKFREMRDKLEKLPPDQRKKALEELREWRDMPPDEKAHLQFMQNEREKRLREAVDEALRVAGLQLDDAQKAVFTKIYLIERRKLEQELRSEMDQRRCERLPALQKNVADAYQKQAASPTPSASPTPATGAP